MIEKAKQIHAQIIEWRRDFHKHPELGFEEKRTAGIVADKLKALGYAVRTGIGKTGVMADLGEGKPCVAIRADMDALPIIEANDVPYKSKVDGVMHACGHDAHTAIALGVATLLTDEEFPGTVRFLFQPSEEMEDDEGLSGAPRMVNDGAMEGVDYVLALHVDSSVKTGSIELPTENAAAGVDTFYGKVLGKGGHGSTPHKVVDPIFISGHVILALHSIVSRRLWPLDSAVISIGSVNGGSIDNVIPEVVEMTGTIRFLNKEVQALVHKEIERAFKIAQTLGGDYELKIVEGYPPMDNSPEVVKVIDEVAVELIGEENVVEPIPEMGSEDFAFFIEKAPGAMLFLGCKIEGDERRHHNPRFDVNEDCLSIGAGVLAETALRFLRREAL
ncbi:M20 family metallopeptidase [Chloroflexota bacterium]